MINSNKPTFEALEERVLLSGTPIETESAIHAVANLDNLAPATAVTEILIVDTSVANYEDLLASFDQRTLDIHFINSAQDGVSEITSILSSYKNLDAVHILSHGSEASVNLGSATLDADSLSSRSDEISSWSKSLSANADILFYGCDLAAGAEGQAFVSSIATLTGADVAASDDITGVGGDAVLEIESGSIETDELFSQKILARANVTLATVLVDNGFEVADGFAESNDNTVVPDQADSDGNSWTFGNDNETPSSSVSYWDGFGSDFASQHIQFWGSGQTASTTAVGDYWAVELAQNTIPASGTNGHLSFDAKAGTSSKLSYAIEGLLVSDGTTWSNIGTQSDWTNGGNSFAITDMSQYKSYRLIVTAVEDSTANGGTDADGLSRIHFDNIKIETVSNTAPEVVLAIEEHTLDGTSTVDLGNSDSVSGDVDFTIQAYIKTTSANASIVSQGSALELVVSGGQLRFNLPSYTAGAGTVNDDAWHQVTLTRSGGQVQTYIDGVQSLSFSAFGGSVFDATQSLVLGNGNFAGEIAGVSVTQGDGSYLTAVEVAASYDAAFAGGDAALKFTEGDAALSVAPTATVADTTSADFNGGSLTVSVVSDVSGALVQDVLASMDASAFASVTNNGHTLTFAFDKASGPTVAQVETLIRSITYLNNSATPDETQRTITFTLNDGDGGTDTTVSTIALTVVDVAAGNTAPTTVADTITLNEGETAIEFDDRSSNSSVLTNDITDDNTETLRAVLISDVSHGTLTLNDDGTFTYVHDGTENFSDSFQYAANDGVLTGNTVTVQITIVSLNDRPVGGDDEITVLEGGATADLTSTLLANDTDSDLPANTLNIKSFTQPTHGTVTRDPITGELIYTHGGSETTSDSFTYIVNDGNPLDGDSDRAVTVNVTVTAVNDNTPEGVASSINAVTDVSYTFTTEDFLFNDADSVVALSSVTISNIALSAGDTLTHNGTDNGDGTITILEADIASLVFTGSTAASFDFVVNDGDYTSQTPVAMSIGVVAAEVPLASNISFADLKTTLEGGVSGQTFYFDSANDIKIDWEASSPIVISNNLTLVNRGTGLLTFDGLGTSQLFQIGTSAITVKFDGINFQNGSAVEGGAIGSVSVGTGTNSSSLEVTNSSFEGNSASNYGGAILSRGAINISNATFMNNTAGSWGAAIGTVSGSIEQSTFVGNLSGGNATRTIIRFTGSAAFTLSNSLVEGAVEANNVAVTNTVTIATGDLEHNGTDYVLQDNGGNVKTIALLAGAQAGIIDSSSLTTGTDARGVEAQDGPDVDKVVTRDLGAYEFEVPNSAPTITAVPTDISVQSAVDSNFDLSAIEVADVDNDTLTVTLTAVAGTFTASTADADITVGGAGNVLTLTGTAGALNNYFDLVTNITYNGTQATTVALKVEDGRGGETTPSTINVALNAAPTIANVPGTITVNKGAASDFDLSGITFADAEADLAGETLVVTLTAATGTFTASADANVTVGGTAGVLTLTGTAAHINTYLGTASNVQFTGSVTTVEVKANDGMIDSSVETILVTEVEPGGPLVLNGTDGVVTVPSHADYNKGTGQGHTVELWVKTTDANGGLISRWDAGQDGFILNVEGGNLAWRVATSASGGQGGKAGSATINDGTWHHVALVISATDIKAYVDGTLDSSWAHSFVNNDWNIAEDLKIGYSPKTSGHGNLTGANAHLEGSIKNVRVWQQERSAQELADDMSNEVPVSNVSNLAANFILNEVTGTTAVDSTLRANNGTLSSGAAWVSLSNTIPVADNNTVAVLSDRDHAFSAADFTYTDVEGDDLLFATITNVSGGTLSYDNGVEIVELIDGKTLSKAQLDTLVFNGPVGTVTFDFTVTDRNGTSATAATMTLNVTNSAPDLVLVAETHTLDNNPLNLGSTDAITGTGAFSVSVWFNTSQGDTTLLSQGAAGSDGFELKLQGGKARVEMPQGMMFNLGSGYADGQWHQMTVTRDGGTLKVYIDGTDIGGYNNDPRVERIDLVAADLVLGKGTFVGDLSTPITSDTALTAQQVTDYFDPNYTGQATVHFTEGDIAVALAPYTNLKDLNSADFNGGSLVVSIGSNLPEHVLASMDASAFAKVTNVNGTLTFAFDKASGPTVAQVEALIQSITYENTSENPSEDARTITFTVIDGDGGTDTATTRLALTVEAVNDAPVLDVVTATDLAYAEDAPAITVSDDITVADFDSTNLTTSTVTVTGFESGKDQLTFTNNTGFTGAYDDTTGVLTITAVDAVNNTLANYESFLRSIQYSNTAELTAGTRTIVFNAIDDSGTATDTAIAASRVINVTSSNDAPVISPITLDVTTINEGGSVALTVIFTDSDLVDTQQIVIDWGDGVTETFTKAPGTHVLNHTYADDSAIDYTITATVEDTAKASDSATTTVTVNNVAPDVNPAKGFTATEDIAFIYNGSFSDPGADTWTATVDYGDGSGVQVLTLTGQTFQLNHTYDRGGNFVVTVVVTDDEGAVASENFNVNVGGVNDDAVATSGNHDLAVDYGNVTVSGQLTNTDVDNNDNVFLPSTQTGAYGTLVFNADGSYTYTAASSFEALPRVTLFVDAFTVQTEDGTETTITINLERPAFNVQNIIDSVMDHTPNDFTLEAQNFLVQSLESKLAKADIVLGSGSASFNFGSVAPGDFLASIEKAFANRPVESTEVADNGEGLELKENFYGNVKESLTPSQIQFIESLLKEAKNFDAENQQQTDLDAEEEEAVTVTLSTFDFITELEGQAVVEAVPATVTMDELDERKSLDETLNEGFTIFS